MVSSSLFPLAFVIVAELLALECTAYRRIEISKMAKLLTLAIRSQSHLAEFLKAKFCRFLCIFSSILS